MKNRKKYFTKWLPIEGDINIEDVIITDWNKIALCKGFTEEGNIITNIQDLAESISECYFVSNKNLTKKAKLFLCSNEVKEGEEICYRNGDVYHIAEYRSNYYDKYNELFKIVGEISKENEWVKGGDEFNEEDITFNWAVTYNVKARNTDEDHEVIFQSKEKVSEDYIQEFVVTDIERRGIGLQYGYKYEIKSEPFIKSVSTKCRCCNKF